MSFLMIRRATLRNGSYTVIFLEGEPPKWILTSEYEHQRILEIYKQDKFYEGIENEFSEFLNTTLDKEKNRSTIQKQHEHKE